MLKREGFPSLAASEDSSCSQKSCGTNLLVQIRKSDLQDVMAALSRLRFETDVIQVQINRSRQMPWAERFEAQNPVWIISGFRISDFGWRNK